VSEIVKKSVFVEATKKYDIRFAIVSSYHHYNFHRCTTSHKLEYDVPEAMQSCNAFKVIDIPMPLLEVGDDFYLEDDNKIVRIEKVMRTSKDNVAYVVATNCIYDEESMELYENEKAAYFRIEKLKLRPWWKKLFGIKSE